MRRTKQWWEILSKDERARLVYLERSNNKIGSHSAYLPDDCTECTSCGQPVMGDGLCKNCSIELLMLTSKPKDILSGCLSIAIQLGERE